MSAEIAGLRGDSSSPSGRDKSGSRTDDGENLLLQMGQRSKSSCSKSNSSVNSSESSFTGGIDQCQARKIIESLGAKVSPIPIISLKTRNYVPNAMDMEVLTGLFGVPQCSSPWKSRGIEGIAFLFIFLIILAAIFFFGPKYFFTSWILWIVLFVFLILVIVGIQFWATHNEQNAVLCQI